jgi:hypothetical protein
LVLRDNPDAFVAIATSIELVVAVSVLAYSFLAERAG